jgi:hypothetical protein
LVADFLYFPLVIGSWIFLPLPFAIFHTALLGLTVVRSIRHPEYCWKLVGHVRHFQTATNGRIVLHFSPNLADKWNLTTLLQRLQQEVDDLANEFGFSLRRRVVVYLFSDRSAIGAIFGPEYGGTALPASNSIVIADDFGLWESIRHELVHLFAARWNVSAPPLLAEGLAVWMQSIRWDQSARANARRFCDNGVPTLSQLLDRGYFFAETQRNASYALAGCFTSFLIMRYGWARYRELYSCSTELRFANKFERCYAVSLVTVEALWKDWMLRRAVPVR